MYSFKVKHNQKTPKDVKMSALQNESVFYIFSFIIKLKISIFHRKSQKLMLSKNRDICYNATYKQHAYKILTQYPYFGLCNGKKAVEDVDVSFWKASEVKVSHPK